MNEKAELIVMLTHNDQTVSNAYEIFDLCRNCKARYWGLKDKPLPQDEMKKLFAYMKQCGKATALEVVSYTEEECLSGVETAAACGCDFLMGTKFFDTVNAVCQKKGIRYMPFVGNVSGCPSVLNGSLDEMVDQANAYLKKGVYGIDFLGYRSPLNAEPLIEAFIKKVDAPVCVAGSINSRSRLDFLKQVQPWAFTIGGAFFENKFQGSIREQIDGICDYMTAQPEKRSKNAGSFVSI